jgi:hypothetical protein
MSLINDALKKAQKQRTGETPSLASMPGIGGESPHRIAKRAKPAGFDTLIIRAGVGAGVVLVLAIGGWLVLSPKAESGRRLGADGEAKLKAEDSNAQTTAQPAAPVAQNPAPSSQPPAQNPQVSGFSSQVSAPVSAPAFTLPVATKVEPPAPAPSSEPQVSGLRSQVSASPPQVSAPPAPVVPAPTGSSLQASPFRPQASPAATSEPQVSGLRSQVSASPAKLEPRAIQFIENIKVGAIMARTSTDAKVLMNDRVYRVGSLVEAEMGLTLVEITTGSLTFEDERGGRYTRTF